MREWVKEDPSLQRSLPVFDMPIAAAIALSMLFIPVIYPPTMPLLLRAIFGVAALLPAVILLRRLLERRTFPVLYALVILFIVDEIRLVTVALPLITRCLFLGQMLGGICFTVWLLRSRATDCERRRCHAASSAHWSMVCPSRSLSAGRRLGGKHFGLR